MATEAVSGPKFFTSRSYTNNGNEYRKSNYGKIAGATLGVGAGAYVATTGVKIYKELFPQIEKSGIFESLPEVLNQIAQNFNEGKALFTEAEIKEFPEYLMKFTKKTFKGVVTAISVGVVLLGLGLGAVGDGITNIIKRKNADKAASTTKSE